MSVYLIMPQRDIHIITTFKKQTAKYSSYTAPLLAKSFSAALNKSWFVGIISVVRTVFEN